MCLPQLIKHVVWKLTWWGWETEMVWNIDCKGWRIMRHTCVLTWMIILDHWSLLRQHVWTIGSVSFQNGIDTTPPFLCLTNQRALLHNIRYWVDVHAHYVPVLILFILGLSSSRESSKLRDSDLDFSNLTGASVALLPRCLSNFIAKRSL